MFGNGDLDLELDLGLGVGLVFNTTRALIEDNLVGGSLVGIVATNADIRSNYLGTNLAGDDLGNLVSGIGGGGGGIVIGGDLRPNWLQSVPVPEPGCSLTAQIGSVFLAARPPTGRSR